MVITLGLIYNADEQRAELWYYAHGAPMAFYIMDGRVVQVECTDAGEERRAVKATLGVELAKELLKLVEPRGMEDE